MLDGSSANSTPEAARHQPAQSRRSPFPDWLPFIVMWMVVGALAYRTAGPIRDPDTWWHLRLGEEFRSNWSLADPGFLTPFATRPWFATQWTLEVLASRAEESFGLPAISWLAGVGVLVLGISIYVSCRQRSAMAAASVATLMSLLGASLSLGPRPQLASFILTAVFTTAWLRTTDDLKARWWLVPLTWFWACTHGMWIIGVAIGALVVLGLAMDRRLSRPAAVRLSLVPLASLAAAALTPVGPKLILAPLATSKMADFVTEWQAPDFSKLGVPSLVAITLALVVVTWARGPRRPWSEVLLLVMAAGWVLLSYRTIAVGSVLAAPLVAGSIQSWLPTDRLRVPRWEVMASLTAAVAIVIGLTLSTSSREGPPVEEMQRMNAALRALPPATVVYNEYTLGGWLEWEHRNIVPTVDGMTDAYDISHIASYVDTARLEPDWLRFINGTNAQYALLKSESRLAAALEELPDWRPQVEQSGYVLLKRNTSKPDTGRGSPR